MTGPRPTSVLCAVCRVLCAVCCADCVLCDTDCVLRYRVKARACTGTGLPYRAAPDPRSRPDSGFVRGGGCHSQSGAVDDLSRPMHLIRCT